MRLVGPKLISGTTILGPHNPHFSNPYSGFLVRSAEAEDLGLRVHSERKQFKPLETDNPLMFHDDLCLEAGIPVCTGFGALTSKTNMLAAMSAVSAYNASRGRAPSTKRRVIRVVPLKVVSRLLRLDLIASQTWASRAGIPVGILTCRVPYVPSDALTDYICTGAPAEWSAQITEVAELSDSWFHESKWPFYSTRRPGFLRTTVDWTAGHLHVMYGSTLQLPNDMSVMWLGAAEAIAAGFDETKTRCVMEQTHLAAARMHQFRCDSSPIFAPGMLRPEVVSFPELQLVDAKRAEFLLEYRGVIANWPRIHPHAWFSLIDAAFQSGIKAPTWIAHNKALPPDNIKIPHGLRLDKQIKPVQIENATYYLCRSVGL